MNKAARAKDPQSRKYSKDQWHVLAFKRYKNKLSGGCEHQWCWISQVYCSSLYCLPLNKHIRGGALVLRTKDSGFTYTLDVTSQESLSEASAILDARTLALGDMDFQKSFVLQGKWEAYKPFFSRL